MLKKAGNPEDTSSNTDTSTLKKLVLELDVNGKYFSRKNGIYFS